MNVSYFAAKTDDYICDSELVLHQARIARACALVNDPGNDAEKRGLPQLAIIVSREDIEVMLAAMDEAKAKRAATLETSLETETA
jgi:hypothetical protein